MVIHPCAKFGMPMSKRKDDLAHTKIHGENIKFDIKVKVIQRSWMYVTHYPMVIHSCARYDKKAAAQTQTHIKNPINLTLRLKVNIISGSWINATYSLMEIDPCAKYGMLMSKQTEVMYRTRRHVKTSINLTRGKSSRWYWDHECTQRILSWW